MSGKVNNQLGNYLIVNSIVRMTRVLNNSTRDNKSEGWVLSNHIIAQFKIVDSQSTGFKNPQTRLFSVRFKVGL